ncbi:MAG TPA: hypothetical protein VI819_05155 [Patescibacteria group bacterium]|nr:hypothetical protein [Patescibacteria group bacterium]
MQTGSELCKICPINESCSSDLNPESATKRRLVINNPWNCRHLTCPAGVEEAKKEKSRLRSKNIFFGYAYFSSKDKPSVRRFDMKLGIIESFQDGQWHSTGQSIYKNYIVDRKNYPYKRIRNFSVKKT